MASAWGSWSTGRKIIGVWKVKHPWSVQSLGYRGWGCCWSTCGVVEVPSDLPSLSHLLHVLFQEESLGLGRVPGTGVSRAPLAGVPPSCAPAAVPVLSSRLPGWLQAV